MRKWIRVTVGGLQCGLCSRPIDPNAPVLLLRGSEWRRTLKRCEACAGPPPTEMPEVHTIGPELDRYVMKNVPYRKTALPFGDATGGQ